MTEFEKKMAKKRAMRQAIRAEVAKLYGGESAYKEHRKAERDRAAAEEAASKLSKYECLNH